MDLYDLVRYGHSTRLRETAYLTILEVQAVNREVKALGNGGFESTSEVLKHTGLVTCLKSDDTCRFVFEGLQDRAR